MANDAAVGMATAEGGGDGRTVKPMLPVVVARWTFPPLPSPSAAAGDDGANEKLIPLDGPPASPDRGWKTVEKVVRASRVFASAWRRMDESVVEIIH